MLTKKVAAISTGALAFAMMTAASPAMASHPFSKPVPGTFKLSGVLNLVQTININCDVHIDVSVNASGIATVTGRSFSSTSPGTSPLCGTVVQPFGTWTIKPVSATQITATVGATSFAGSCSGSISGAWSNANDTLTFINGVVPGTPSSCTVNGVLTADQDVEI